MMGDSQDREQVKSEQSGGSQSQARGLTGGYRSLGLVSTATDNICFRVSSLVFTGR